MSSGVRIRVCVVCKRVLEGMHFNCARVCLQSALRPTEAKKRGYMNALYYEYYCC